MKTKSIVALALLFVMSFSIFHEFVFTYFDDDYCTTTEYVAELEGQTEHGDICDIHYEYHSSYIMPQYNNILIVDAARVTGISKNSSYLLKTYLEFYKPPIV